MWFKKSNSQELLLSYGSEPQKREEIRLSLLRGPASKEPQSQVDPPILKRARLES
jgi:hypothetical protein